jgi:hypothetical protein
VNLRRTLEGTLFYANIPSITLYPLGFFALDLQREEQIFKKSFFIEARRELQCRCTSNCIVAEGKGEL